MAEAEQGRDEDAIFADENTASAFANATNFFANRKRTSLNRTDDLRRIVRRKNKSISTNRSSVVKEDSDNHVTEGTKHKDGGSENMNGHGRIRCLTIEKENEPGNNDECNNNINTVIMDNMNAGESADATAEPIKNKTESVQESQDQLVSTDTDSQDVTVRKSSDLAKDPEARKSSEISKTLGKIKSIFRGSSRTSRKSRKTKVVQDDASDSDSADSWHDCWSDFESASSEESSSEDEFEDAEDELQVEKPKYVPKDRLYNISHELMFTEEAYVERLGILLKVKAKTSKILQADIVKQMFKDIEVIHQFHHDYLLPQLKDRMKKWDTEKRIGDVMKRLAPFLKLYTEYVKNFQNASDLVESWSSKSSEFSALMKEVQVSPEYGRLRVQAHMLEPVQRVPRYELLLKDYIKHLPEDSPDREDSQRALDLVAEAAHHFESMMKRDSKILKLMELQNQLDGNVNIVAASRELVRQGKIMKVNARDGKVVDRYIFLFNDMLVLCSEYMLSVQGVTAQYRVRGVMEAQGMQISEGNNLDVPNTFYVKTKEKALELCTGTQEEKEEWMEILWKVVGESTRDKLMRRGTRRPRDTMIQRKSLGKRAPVWVHNTEVSMCMMCAAEFNALRRKRHCRACGIVICGKCSSHTAKLEYDPSKIQRVCDECFLALRDREPHGKNNFVKVRAQGKAFHSGYMQLSADDGKTWKKRWFAVHKPGMLYSFKAHQDICPLTSLSLEEYTSSVANHPSLKNKHVFVLTGEGKAYLLQEENAEKMKRWLDALNETIQEARRGSTVTGGPDNSENNSNNKGNEEDIPP